MQSSVGHILGIVAAVVRGVAAVIAAVILVYALFILFGANPNNGLVTFTAEHLQRLRRASPRTCSRPRRTRSTARRSTWGWPP